MEFLIRTTKEPSQTALFSNKKKTIRERKSWFPYHLIDKEPKKRKKRIVVDKKKVEWLKASRDYSFLSSSDNDLEFQAASYSSSTKLVNPRPRIVVNVKKSCTSMMEKEKKAEVSRKQVSSSSSDVWRRRKVIYDDDDDDDIDNDVKMVATNCQRGEIGRKEDAGELMKIVEQGKKAIKKRKMH